MNELQVLDLVFCQFYCKTWKKKDQFESFFKSLNIQILNFLN